MARGNERKDIPQGIGFPALPGDPEGTAGALWYRAPHLRPDEEPLSWATPRKDESGGVGRKGRWDELRCGRSGHKPILKAVEQWRRQGAASPRGESNVEY